MLIHAIRRKLDRFPADLMFSLTRQKVRNISQIVISPTKKPFANWWSPGAAAQGNQLPREGSQCALSNDPNIEPYSPLTDGQLHG